MGSSGSKACGNEPTTASSSKKARSSRANNWLFQSSCLGSDTGTASGSRHTRPQRDEENGGNQSETESDELKIECDRKEKDEIDCISNSDELDGWGEANITSVNGNGGTGSSSARSSSNPCRFLSRFSFIPGNISFRLSRAASLGSSRGYNTDEHGRSSSNFPHNLEEIQNAARDDGDGVGNNRVGIGGNVCSPRVFNELDNVGSRVSDRRIGAREPVERNVRFSRTLSVGRLRDRVLRRSSLSDITFCPLQQERLVRDANQRSARNAFGGDTEILSSTPEGNGNGVTSPLTSGYPPSSRSSSLFGIQDHEVETSRSREARYHDLLEHRSNFLERRRRIRSQVRALQRLGSRFENLSGHERSCILSGQHRTGRCTCRVSNRDANSGDETGTRASISRIVMLAEALFEVLDEIHQQSVVLSSRPSMSSIGSIPAPNEVVESLPVKLYTKSQKYQNEEVAQCYICLLEYEEGDNVRILPCHHEFHKTCVDKWLKEIHRVCPLCRGDICKPDSLPSEN